MLLRIKDHADRGQLDVRGSLSLAVEAFKLLGESEAFDAERKVRALAYVMRDRALRGVR